MEPSSRTPEGRPNQCPLCGKEVRLEASFPPGDAPCPHCGCLLWFDSDTSDGVAGVRRVGLKLEKILDEATIRRTVEQFEMVCAGANLELLLSFERVEFVSSSAIGELIRLGKRCGQEKIRLKLSRLNPSIREVFKLMKLDDTLDIDFDEE
jgi:anti-anti-sigma factor